MGNLTIKTKTDQVIDRKYIDAKVIEAHIVPGKLLVTRWVLHKISNISRFYYSWNMLVCLLSEKYLTKANAPNTG